MKRYKSVMVRLLFILLLACALSIAMGFITGFLVGTANEQLKIKDMFDQYVIEKLTEED